jgi:Receptor family ligand binding region
LDPGWFHMAAALLAVDRFNAKNCSGLSALCVYQDSCPLQFGNVVAIDTGTNNHQAMEFVVEQLLLKKPEEWAVVDAIAGPYHELPALELSVLATGLQAPMVSHRALDSTLLNPARHPYFSQVNADFLSEMQFVVRYLNHLQRPNFVAILYSSTASALQKVDLLGRLLDQEGFDQVRAFSYRAKGDSATDTLLPMDPLFSDRDRSIADALERIQATGYRTIYVLPGQLDTDLPEIGIHATRLGLNEGGHFWIVGGGAEQMSSTEIVHFLQQQAQSNTTIARGAAYLYPVDHEPPIDLTYHTMWRQSSEFFQRVQDMLPTWTISSTIDFDETAEAIENAFIPMMQTPSEIRWWNGASYMYDAVMTIGLGACKALEQSNQTTPGFTGKQHLDGIRATEFDGASGHIRFGNPSAPGSRDSNTIFFGVMNVLPNGNEA